MGSSKASYNAMVPLTSYNMSRVKILSKYSQNMYELEDICTNSSEKVAKILTLLSKVLYNTEMRLQ